MTVFRSEELSLFDSRTGSKLLLATLEKPIVLARLECVSLLEFDADFLLIDESLSLPSLLITSARALPTEARFRE